MAIILPEKPLAKNPFRRAKRVPIIGPYIGRVGRVIQILSHPCQPTPELWVYASFVAIPTAIFTFFKPSPTDYLGDRLTHGGRRSRKFRLAQYGEHQGFPVPTGGPSWVVFRTLLLLRAAGMYISIADATTAGALIWVSTAYRWNGCVVPGGMWASSTLLDGSVELLGPGSGFIQTFIVQGSQGLFVDNSSIGVPFNQHASVGCSASSRPNTHHLPDAEYSLTMVNLSSGLDVANFEQHRDSEGNVYNQAYFANGWANANKSTNLVDGGIFAIRYTKGFGVIEWAAGGMSATTSPSSDAVAPDP